MLRRQQRLLTATLLLLSILPTMAQISDPDGDADLACIDITSVDVYGDPELLVIAMQVSLRPPPNNLRLDDGASTNHRLCPRATYEFLIDSNLDGTSEHMIRTTLDRGGSASTTGPEGLSTEIDVASGRIIWRLPTAVLAEPIATLQVALMARARLQPANARLTTHSLHLMDSAPARPVAFTIGAPASRLIDSGGGRIVVENPLSPLLGTDLTIPAGALLEPTCISIIEASISLPAPRGATFGPAFTLLPHHLVLSVPAVLKLPFDPGDLPEGFTSEDRVGLTRYDESTGRQSWLPLVDSPSQVISALIPDFSSSAPSAAAGQQLPQSSAFGWASVFSRWVNHARVLGDSRARGLFLDLAYACYGDADRQLQGKMSWTELSRYLIKKRIQYVFANVGKFQSDGALLCGEDGDPQRTTEFLEALADFRSNHGGHIVAWMTVDSNDLEGAQNQQLRNCIASRSADFVDPQQYLSPFDGVMLDIEPFDRGQARSQDDAFLTTVHDVRVAINTRPNYPELWVHCPAYLLDPEWGISGFWLRESYENVLNVGGADAITVNFYDYGDHVTSEREYRRAIADSIDVLTETLPRDSVMPAVSADVWAESGAGSHTAIERVAVGSHGIKDAETNSVLFGAALYTNLLASIDDEDDTSEWSSFRELFWPSSAGATEPGGEYPNWSGRSDDDVLGEVRVAWQSLRDNGILVSVSDGDVIIDRRDGADGWECRARSEGLGYALMVAVQRNDQQGFERLWNWADRHLRISSASAQSWAGLFSSSCLISCDGLRPTECDDSPAPDGDEWVAMALTQAAARWNRIDYRSAANEMLSAMLRPGNGGPLFDPTAEKVVFLPSKQPASCTRGGLNQRQIESSIDASIHSGPGADIDEDASGHCFTNPSYHVPAFYEVWAGWASTQSDRDGWWHRAWSSRELLHRAADPVTALCPDLAEYDGRAHPAALQRAFGTDGENFRFDAWRCGLNRAIDYVWFKQDGREAEENARLLRFFSRDPDYVNQYSVDGTRPCPDLWSGPDARPARDCDSTSVGLLAMNGASAMSSEDRDHQLFIEELWDSSPPENYYNALLRLLGLLVTGGQFRSYVSPDVADRYEVHYSAGITWQEARDKCQALGAHLATLTTQAENELVTSLLGGTSVWIGGYQDRSAPDYHEARGGWRWVTAEPFDCQRCFSNWYPGEPNNYEGGEDFLELGGGVSFPRGYWNDNRSPTRSVGGYVCERE